VQFTVELLNEQPGVARYYWRDRVYDQYENGEWLISFDDEELAAGTETLGFPNPSQQIGEFRFTTAKQINLLHSAPQPLDLNRNVVVTFAPNPDGSLDLAALRSPTALQIGEAYEMLSGLTVTNASDLRATGANYPAWVTERYLQVPPEITQRTRDLAARLAEGLDNNYDIAVAVTSYLRNTITYQDSVPSPPANAEPIDWVLFEEPRGFCNYYASAQVILLRTLGIPARLAVGYAQGDRLTVDVVGGQPGEDRLEERLNETIFYTVRQRDAHAWPEVYFPGIGWVEFEPTANQQELVRVQTGADSPDDLTTQLEDPAEKEAAADESNPEPEEQASRVIRESIQQQALQGIVLFAILALLAFAILARRFTVRDNAAAVVSLSDNEVVPIDNSIRARLMRRVRAEKFGPLERTYAQMNNALVRLGLAPKAGHTPSERAAALALEIPELAAELLAIGESYQAKLYSINADTNEIPGLFLRIRLQFAVWRGLVNKRFSQVRDWLRGLNPFTRPML
jgi:hypothetical protein